MLARMAVRLELASRVQFVAWVAPLAKVPKTMVMAADQVMVSLGAIRVIACQPLRRGAAPDTWRPSAAQTSMAPTGATARPAPCSPPAR